MKMANQNNSEEFMRTALSLGIAFSSILQRNQEAQQEQERKLALRKTQARTNAIRQDLINRKNTLANRVAITIERLSDPAAKEMAQARLDQILNADLARIPEYEQLIDSLYPGSIVQAPVLRPIYRLAPPQLIPITHSQLTMFDLLRPPPAQPNRVLEIKEDEKKINISQFSELERLADDVKSGNLTCAICLEKFAANDKDVEIRRCLHTFHKKCLTTWENTGRTNGKTCPCCRQ